MKLLTLLLLLIGGSGSPGQNVSMLPGDGGTVMEPTFVADVTNTTTVDKTTPPGVFLTPLPFPDVVCAPVDRFFKAQKEMKDKTPNKVLMMGEGLDGGTVFINKYSDGSAALYRISVDGKTICYLGAVSSVEIDKGTELWDGSDTEG